MKAAAAPMIDHLPIHLSPGQPVAAESPPPGGEARGRRYTPCRLGGSKPVTVLIPDPDPLPEVRPVGMELLIERCRAAWLAIDRRGPQHFRLIGPPGVGKNTLVYYLAELEGRPLHMMLGHEELTPEDIACSARITESNGIEYVGSPLLAAMVRGGICFFDEIGKAPSRSLSLLAPVLDERRTLTSMLAGFTVEAHPDFRFCAALNDDDEVTSGLPGYLDERLRPALKIGFPPLERLREILRGAEGGSECLVEAFCRWAAGKDRLSPRIALSLVGFAARLCLLRSLDPARMRKGELDRIVAEAAQTIDLERRTEL